jgi:hypothetical protein
MLFEELLNKENINYMEHIVSPIAPYFICNHYISTEIYPENSKFIECNINIKANDLLKNNNFSTIKNGDIVLVTVDMFNYFYDFLLPLIKVNNKKIILITCQYHLPQLFRSERTDNCLNDSNILLWISQNPIYENSKKYMAFPYGMHQNNINNYINFIKNNKNIETNKNTKIFNPFASVHSHLPFNHIRRKIDLFGKNSGSKLDYNSYLQNISNSEFIISTSGDRDDSYRHYECIGLYAIPITNINYRSIFNESMIYSNGNEMVNMVKTNTVNCKYNKPNRDILTIKFWIIKINEFLA